MLVRREFPTWATFVDAARSRVEWTPELRTLVDEGWLDGAARARRLTGEITNAIGNLIDRIVINYDVEGHALDVGRYLDHEPECWQRFDTEHMQQPAMKYIKLVINGSYSMGISESIVIGRGAVAAALVELLEFAGHRVEVVMARCMQPSEKQTYLTLTTIKRFDEPIDMPKIAFALAHPDVLQGLHFPQTKNDPDAKNFYGRPANIPVEDQGDICLDRMRGDEPQWESPRRAIEWVKERLKDFGVTMHESTLTQ